jgi:hypothetical protein
MSVCKQSGRTGTGQFVVPYDRYVESGKICSVGTRFRMIFSEATTERRYNHVNNLIFMLILIFDFINRNNIKFQCISDK